MKQIDRVIRLMLREGDRSVQTLNLILDLQEYDREFQGRLDRLTWAELRLARAGGG
jgi:hypothetical protein